MSSIVTVTISSSSFDLVSLMDLKEELGITADTSNSKLQRWIAEESARISSYCGGRIFQQETISEALRVTAGSPDYIRLSRSPIISVTSVTEEGTLLTAPDYEMAKPAGVLYRLSGADRTYWAAGNFVVIYVAGYGPLLSAITFAAYVKEIQGAEAKWDKTEKSGQVSVGAR